jgi:uncharacterized SAM-binding protein YcdF (DUF218 family)
VRFARLAVRTLAVLLSLVLVTLLFVAGRIWWVARQDDRRASDVIVVLGAAQFDGRPSSVFTARLGHAETLWDAKVAPRIITVGGNLAGDRFTEASAGKRWLAGRGVDAAKVIAVGTGSDTLGSMKAVAKEMRKEHWSKAVIVTDPWHSLRTRSMARSVGIDAVTSPARQGPAVRTRGTELRYIGRETLAYVYFQVFRRSSDAGPDAL